MRFSVSTIKDSPENVEFFVRANLAQGIDHMFVVVDAPGQPGQQRVAQMLDEHPHVTCLRSNKRWWDSQRPARLNVRQRANANWAKEVLAPFEWARWLFHVDGDEVVRLDDAALEEVPAEATTVWLQPLEAVSELEPPTRPTRFKRLLDDDELNLLHVLGLLEHPSNQYYFHGHLMGKVGVRPSAPVALALHHAIATQRGVDATPYRDDRLGLLHYDAVSGTEFIRKWEALATAGSPRFRASRMPSARALTHLVNADLDPEVRRRHLQRIYEATTADDVATLGELGLLVDADPLASPREPQPFPPGAREALEARVAELSAGEKRRYYVPDPKPSAAERALRRVKRRVRGAQPHHEHAEAWADGDGAAEVG